MTNDDREDARRGGEGGHEPPSRASAGTFGGLLDGLPESGRGARPQSAAGPSANPFRQVRQPAAEPAPASAAKPPAAEPPAAKPPAAPTVPVAEPPAPAAEAPAPAPEAPAPETPAPAPEASAPASPPPAPETSAAPREPGPPGPGSPAATAAGGDADRGSVTTEPEQSMHLHEAAAPESQHTGPPQARPTPSAATAPGHAYGDAERAAVYRAIRDRRDIEAGFRPDPVPDDVLTRVLEAAHQAPSIGGSRPWDFVVVDDPGLRARVRDLAAREREEYTRALPGTRSHAVPGLEVEAVLEAPLNIAVTVDPARGVHHAAGRHSRPASYASALAVENLWLAARAEGLGVGWVGLVDEHDVARALELPDHLEVVAYLCVGYVEEFPAEPEPGPGVSEWTRGRPLSWAVHRDRYGRRGLPGQKPTTLLEETITAIGALNTRAVEEARDRQNRMTKPPGSLGVLEEVSVRLAGLAGECPPPVPEPAAVAVFAGDHGVHAQGVSSWPQEVTGQMVHNFLRGGAVVNAFAAQVGAEVTVVDVGVAADLPRAPGLLPRKVARGTADFTQGPAMTREQAMQALESGIEIARDLVAAGNRCLITGDMGIANTTPSAALVCAYTGADPERATGRGTGADDTVYKHKIEVVRRALAANPVDPGDPIGTLAALGGLEHAALAGFVLGGAALRVPVLLDGVIAGSAALAAAAISPESVSAFFAGHRSSEPGHGLILEHLGLRPLVDLEMRLGEGSGALLALPLLQSAARVLRDVATFDDAGVSTAP